jgi:hypothetical protein
MPIEEIWQRHEFAATGNHTGCLAQPLPSVGELTKPVWLGRIEVNEDGTSEVRDL